MGSSASAYLFYGIDLGESPELVEPDETSENDDDDETEDFADLFSDKLLAHAGFVEKSPEFPTAEEGEDYYEFRKGPVFAAWAEERAAYEKRKEQACLNLEVVFHGFMDGTFYAIGCSETIVTAYQGDATPIDVGALAALDTHALDERIRQACEIVGIPFEQPKWLMVTMYG